MRPPIRLLLTALALASCGDADGPPERSEGPPIVASIHPVAALVRGLAGEGVDVVVLLPPGAHADTYEPTPRAARVVEDAALIVKVGAGLDGWVGTGGADAPVVVLTDGLPLRAGNPHVWLDPILVRDRLLPRLAEALAAREPGGAAGVRGRAEALADSLTALDGEIRRLLSDLPTRRFVAAHPAWTYFADRYGLEQVGVVHPSPGEEIGTRELARLVGAARSHGVRAVIAEPQLGRAGVVALADELDVAVEVADPIGGPGLEGRDGYLELMRWNARAFARALGGAR